MAASPEAVVASASTALHAIGVGSPGRIRRLITGAVERLDLRLQGLRVLTEAGSGVYALTPAIAIAAGADEVIAVSRDSPYGAADANLAAAGQLAALFDGASRLTALAGRPGPREIARADIITNLGFVRPIDAGLLAHAKPTAAVPLMCEAWEWRDGDVDLATCRQLGIPVLGTNEDAAAVRVFDYSGPLAGRLLFEAGFEVWRSSVVVYGPDRFGPVIARWLERAGSDVHLTADLRSPATRRALADADALLVADYARRTAVVAEDGEIAPADLAAVAPAISVIQFAGALDAASLARHGIPVYPQPPVGPQRMARTLAHLGPRPVVDLHAAGLKVGELACRARRAGLSREDAEARLTAASELVQAIGAPDA